MSDFIIEGGEIEKAGKEEKAENAEKEELYSPCSTIITDNDLFHDTPVHVTSPTSGVIYDDDFMRVPETPPPRYRARAMPPLPAAVAMSTPIRPTDSTMPCRVMPAADPYNTPKSGKSFVPVYEHQCTTTITTIEKADAFGKRKRGGSFTGVKRAREFLLKSSESQHHPLTSQTQTQTQTQQGRYTKIMLFRKWLREQGDGFIENISEELDESPARTRLIAALLFMDGVFDY